VGIDDYLRGRAARIDRALAERMAERRSSVEPRLLEAMEYSLSSPGKRLRPILVLASAEALGAEAEPLVPFACAVEMVHTYSLIHDDLPAMDDDDLRRGQPTSHKVFGEAIAILAGDALLTEAFVVMSSAGEGIAAERRLAAIAEVAVAAGAQGMVGGQTADILAEGVGAAVRRGRCCAPPCASGGSWRARERPNWDPSHAMGMRSAWGFKSPMTCSTSSAIRS